MAAILFVVPRFHTNLWFATRALIEGGHRVEVAVETIADGEDHKFVQPVHLGAEPKLPILRDLVVRASPDLMIVRGSNLLLQRAATAAKGRGVRVLGYNQRPMTRVTSVTRRIRTALRGLPPRRITPMPGLDLNARRDPAATYVPFPVATLPHGTPKQGEDGPIRILCVGKLAQRRKNQHLLLNALRPLRTERRFDLTLVGSTGRAINGADEDHFDALMAASAEPWITVRTDVTFDAMADLYASHDICVLPSVGEPLGSAPLEAMAYGTIPVISTDAGAAGLITDGENGLRVDVTREGALEDAMRRLLDDADLGAKLSEGARHFSETELSPSRYVARIEALLPRP